MEEEAATKLMAALGEFLQSQNVQDSHVQVPALPLSLPLCELTGKGPRNPNTMYRKHHDLTGGVLLWAGALKGGCLITCSKSRLPTWGIRYPQPGPSKLKCPVCSLPGPACVPGDLSRPATHCKGTHGQSSRTQKTCWNSRKEEAWQQTSL